MRMFRWALFVTTLLLVAGSGYAANALSLVLPDQPKGGWEFGNGPEFPGATGGLSVETEDDKPVLVLQGNFTKGGNYVQAGRNLPKLAFDRLTLRLKAPGCDHLTMRLNDASGQCHQIVLKLDKKIDGWQTIDFPVLDFFKNKGTSAALACVARYERWGGANDDRWHAPGKNIYLLAGRPEGSKELTIRFGELCIHPTEGEMFREGFEQGEPFPKGWAAQGTVVLDGDGALKGAKSLKLSRTVDNLQQETVATGPTFAAAPGAWNMLGACRSDLNSPDNSYHGAVSLQALDANGGVLETAPLQELFKKTEWQEFQKRIELPNGTTGARFVVRLNKADGSFWADELAAVRLAENVEKRVDRIVLSTDRLGNLLLPDDKPVVHVRVVATRALRDDERNLVWSVRDYWGAEQAPPAVAALEDKGRSKNGLTYAADLDLSGVNLDLGRYYELHAELPRKVGEPDREFAGLARLPLAASKAYPPEEIPFTIRNWDSRIKEYFLLADRIGIRQLGVWGGWGAKPPYKPQLPGLETVKALEAKWVTGTPGASIETQGFKEYDETSLREGMTNFLKEYADKGLALICLGNEPHGKLPKVKENVKAYRALYEAIKAFDPKITVVGTSVEPNEDYFSEGYFNYLDVYDFHVYETYQDMRKAMREYRTLMEKYKAVKPICSTEVGLNSQGMTRYVVAKELVKKCTSFFAEGGLHVSWFTIQYPDANGKARGQSGDAHCVFDCQYNQYSPRLDAVMYYTMVNGLCVKKFVGEKTYAEGTQAYLFRDKDDRCMQVLWNETGRREVAIPLVGVAGVEVVRIDGRRATLTPETAGLTVSVSAEPVLLFYTQKEASLAGALAAPTITLVEMPLPVAKGKETAFLIRGEGLTPGTLRVDAPPSWNVSLNQKEKDMVECKLAMPEATAAREGRVSIQKRTKDAVSGEISILVPVAGSK
jgi:hypothetical protein